MTLIRQYLIFTTFFSGYGRLAPGATRSFMPAGLEDVDFFKDE